MAETQIHIYLDNGQKVQFCSKPLWMKILSSKSIQIAFYPYVYLPDYQYHHQAIVYNTPILHHKIQHIKQQLKFNKWIWLFKYFTNKKFRLTMEAEAIAVEILYTENIKRNAMLKIYAKKLCNYEYFWCAESYYEAKKTILEAFTRRARL